MNTIELLVKTLALGAGATACIDLWALVLRSLGVRSLSYCLLGRWVLHMRQGRFLHHSIAAAEPRAHECKAGWAAHYSIGAAFAAGFVALVSTRWIEHPTLAPAIAFGAATVVVPFFTMQPAFGLGIASARTPQPNLARLKSLATHTVFGAGLYVSALLLGWANRAANIHIGPS